MHSQLTRLMIVVAFAGNLSAAVVDASALTANQRKCSKRSPVEFASTPLPIGCEMEGCCPGCVDGPLEIVLDFSAPQGSEVRITVEDVPSIRIQTLRHSATIEWRNSQFVLQPGEHRISGWPSATDLVPFLAPRVYVELDAPSTAGVIAQEGPHSLSEVTAEFSVTQLLGRVPVREYAARFTAGRCTETSSSSDAIQVEKSDHVVEDSFIALFDARRSYGWHANQLARGTPAADMPNILSAIVDNILSSGDQGSRLAVFSGDHAVGFRPNVPGWTDAAGDMEKVPRDGLIHEEVTIWVIVAESDTKMRAERDAVRATQLFNEMYGGIGFASNVTVKPVDPTKMQLLVGDCSVAGLLRSEIGFIDRQINVYYNQNRGAGWWCGYETSGEATEEDRDTIVVGTQADGETLAHELGHALSLGHSNSVSEIPVLNLMFSGGVNRDSITIGQLFRANLDATSVLNQHGHRPGGKQFACATSNVCPGLAIDVNPR